MPLFHVLYQNFFKSDCHSQIIADSIESAAKKIEFFVKKRSSRETAMGILNDKDFRKRFPKGIKFMIVYYQTGGGEKFRLIATSSGTENETTQIFQQKFPDILPARIEPYEQYKAARVAKKQQAEEKTTTAARIINRCGIKAKPYAVEVA